MSSSVFVREYKNIPVNLKEVYRYSKTPFGENEELFSECIKQVETVVSFKVCYVICPVKITDTGVDFGFCRCSSSDLKKNLMNCEKAVIFGATAGFELDRIIRKYSIISPSKAVIFQAFGSERVESLCDKFCEEVMNDFEGGKSVARFSPGYGDLSLDFQKNIFDILSLPKNVGITLNDNYFMSPSKSVTAIMGITFSKDERKNECT